MLRASELYRKRYQLLQKLYLIYPDIAFQAQNKSGWTTTFSFIDLKEHMYSPCIHYSILPCEVVFEIESEEGLETVTDFLNDLGIEYVFGFSGNRSWHIHFLVKPKGASIEEFAAHPDTRKFVRAFYKLLASEIEGVKLDHQPMLGHGKIRSFYSQHIKTGCFKIPSRDSYPVWTLSRLWYRIVRKKLEEESVKPINSFKRYNRFEQVEQVLAKLEKYKARETSDYIYYHCPFHPPDRQPSFTYNKKKGNFTDWHTGKVYSGRTLLRALETLSP